MAYFNWQIVLLSVKYGGFGVFFRSGLKDIDIPEDESHDIASYNYTHKLSHEKRGSCHHVCYVLKKVYGNLKKHTLEYIVLKQSSSPMIR